jgi:microcystin-dependent protein
MLRYTSSLFACGVITATMLGAATQSARAGIEPYISEIMFIAGPFCPVGWLPADGRELQIRDNTALFSLLGTTYGGNGIDTYRLPRLNKQVVASGREDGVKFQITLPACIAVQGIFPSRP